MANMSNGNVRLFFIAFFICQFHSHFGYATKNPSPSYSSNDNNVTCIESERRALLEIKGSLVDKANRLASWTTTGEDCCNWDGITCNPHTGHVQKLHLRNPIQFYRDEYNPEKDNIHSNANEYCLGGEINPSILNLEHLNYLDLSCNNFSGIQIPTFLGSLQKLTYLNLTNAGFIGEIPSHLGNLSNLQYLYLGDSFNGYFLNLLTARSLNWITGLASLKALDLSSTDLTGSADWLYSINMLPSLSSLSLRGCGIVPDIVSPPLSLVNLTSLVSIDLGFNSLNSSIDFVLFNLSSQLAVLRLDNNLLQDPIPIMSEKLLTTLILLDLSANNFNSPSILDSLCNHTNFVYLDLSQNQFQGSLPLCFGNLTSLRVLHLSFNKFGGKIPSELGYLKQLTSLQLSSNAFKCSIPSSFGQLTELENLDLGYNQLYGIVPSTIGQLTKLHKLDMSFNSLTGELSESHFAKLESLKWLSISGNYFISFIMSSQWIPPFQLQVIRMDSVLLGHQIPPWLQTQRDLEILSMNNASISSVMPEWFTSWSSINNLYLSNNKIQGSSISFPPNVYSLDLSNNFLAGALSFYSNYLTNMPLKHLNLDDNHLAGDIQDNLCNLKSLRTLSLANNQLTGRIPLCFGNFNQLFVLDLSNNSFSGRIPSMLGNLEHLCFLHLDRNNFYGELPSSLRNLKFLTHLVAGKNQLTGTIPEWIGKELSRLTFLTLESNNFYGNISPHLCQLSALQILNLAQNNLEGHIPRCFDNFTLMRSTDANAPLLVGFSDYSETLWIVIKRVEIEYSVRNLNREKFISLSTNNLQGEIPSELLDLEGLQSLNLSNNKFSGRIPENIGKLKNLEFLDLAMNHLSGSIPQSLANIDTLSYLNLSFNNLVGRIPSGSDFDTLSVDQSVYEGNSGLCGKPLANSCPDDGTSEGKGTAGGVHEKIDGGFELLWFYYGVASGFAVGSMGVYCFLYCKSWQRHAMKISQFLRRLN